MRFLFLNEVKYSKYIIMGLAPITFVKSTPIVVLCIIINMRHVAYKFSFFIALYDKYNKIPSWKKPIIPLHAIILV